MIREGHFQQCIYRGGDEWWDEYFYTTLAQEWFQQKIRGKDAHNTPINNQDPRP